MVQVKRLGLFALIAVAAVLCVGAGGRSGDAATLIQLRPVTKFKGTKTTADRSNTVTAGVVPLLHDGIATCGSASSHTLSNDNRSRPDMDWVIAASDKQPGWRSWGQRKSSATEV